MDSYIFETPPFNAAAVMDWHDQFSQSQPEILVSNSHVQNFQMMNHIEQRFDRQREAPNKECSTENMESLRLGSESSLSRWNTNVGTSDVRHNQLKKDMLDGMKKNVYDQSQS